MRNKKELIKKVLESFRTTIVLMVVCGLIFPLFLTLVGGLIFPSQANGNAVTTANGEVVGSKYVGQEFTEPYFMKGRPSAVHYNTYFEDEEGNKTYADGSEFGGLSSGSNNYGPSNPALVERVEADMEAVLEANPGLTKEDIPTDLVTASGSGLDPHISVASAEVQIPAIAAASGIDEATLRSIVEENTTHKVLGIFGEETVNVLGVNVQIAELMGINE